MTVIAVAMVRDEGDIIGYTLDRMLAQVDHVIVCDNGSTDGTREIVAGRDRVTIVDDPEHVFQQGAKMTALARRAVAAGADWVVPFDADEAFELPDFDQVDADIALFRGHVYVPRPPASDNPLEWEWRLPDLEHFPKVAFRAHPDIRIHEGQHGVDHPGCRVVLAGRYRHYQYRSLRQVARKVRQGSAALARATVPPSTGDHWHNLARCDDAQLAEWWDRYLAQPLVHDP